MEIEKIETQIETQIETHVKRLEKGIEYLEKGIEYLKQKIDSLDCSESEEYTLKMLISQLKNDIKDLKEKKAIWGKDLSGIQSEIDELKEEKDKLE